MSNIRDSIEKIKGDIEENKTCHDVVLVGATKTRDITTIEQAVIDGLRVAGENRVQELLEKYKPIDGLSWHFIGALQTNKVKYIVDKVDLIHSVDRLELAREIDRRCAKINKVMPVLIEVNIGGEESKSGVAPSDLFELLEKVILLPNIKVCGLMTVMPKNAGEELYVKAHELFVLMKERYMDLPIQWLSMGMSGDYLTALRNGSNMIRLGTALFGERVYPTVNKNET